MISTPSLVSLKHKNFVSALQYSAEVFSSTGVSCLKHMDIYLMSNVDSCPRVHKQTCWAHTDRLIVAHGEW